jgi:hypothetical protein
MKHGPNFLVCVFALGLTAGCASSDPCPGGWMTFFVDEQAVLTGAISGVVCDGIEGCEGKSSATIPGFWKQCAGSPSLCGESNHWVCMQPGATSYQLDALTPEADPDSHVGTFNIPPVEGENCRMRAYVNSASPHLQTMSCGPGRFYGPDASFGPTPDEDNGAVSDEGEDPGAIVLDADSLDPCGVGSICQPTWLGDGSCDAPCNCAATEFDGRDCLPQEGAP